MSMRALGKRGIPKGVLQSPVKAAIVAHLKAHGERSSAQLLQAILDAGVASEEDFTRDAHWLQHRLYELRTKGHIERRFNEANQLLWSIAADASQEEESAPQARLALPRQISVMDGTYVSPAGAPTRAGAMDFASMPSLIGSRRVPFRSAP